MMGMSSLTDKQELKDQITRLKARNTEVENAIDSIQKHIMRIDDVAPNQKLWDILEIIKKVS